MTAMSTSCLSIALILINICLYVMLWGITSTRQEGDRSEYNQSASECIRVHQSAL